MTAAEKLRRAAKVLRERAEAATPGPWYVDPKSRGADVRGLPENTSYDYRGDSVATAADGDFGACGTEDATYIALLDPTVALAVADWLEFEAKVMMLHLSEGRLFPVDRAERSDAVADAILAGVEG
jgi:hypothetical protein